MSNELPRGWEYHALQQCADVLDNRRVPVNSEKRAKRKGNIPYFGATGQVGWIDDFLFNEELLLLGEDGAPFLDKSKPISYIICGKTWVNNHAHVLRARQGVTTNQYLKHFFNWLDFREYVNGTTRLKLTQGSMNSIPVPLAPLNEQQRIAAKLEKLLGKVDACQRQLAKIPILLKRFRQSVLAAACSGRLTADLREHGNGSEELPHEWHWATLEDLLPPGGIFDGPFGSNLKSSDYVDFGVRVVRLENIAQLRFVGEKETYISFEKYGLLKKHTLFEDDIIFASFIDDEIRACLIPKLKTKAIAKADCFCLRPNADLVNRAYLLLQLVSQESYNQLLESVHGATRPRINTTQLRKLKVRLCPNPEQQEIVKRVHELWDLAAQIEARYVRAKAHVDKLTQSILAKAFRGELVSQDPSDEPASELIQHTAEVKKPKKQKEPYAVRPN